MYFWFLINKCMHWTESKLNSSTKDKKKKNKKSQKIQVKAKLCNQFILVPLLHHSALLCVRSVCNIQTWQMYETVVVHLQCSCSRTRYQYCVVFELYVVLYNISSTSTSSSSFNINIIIITSNKNCISNINNNKNRNNNNKDNNNSIEWIEYSLVTLSNEFNI